MAVPLSLGRETSSLVSPVRRMVVATVYMLYNTIVANGSQRNQRGEAINQSHFTVKKPPISGFF